MKLPADKVVDQAILEYNIIRVMERVADRFFTRAQKHADTLAYGDQSVYLKALERTYVADEFLFCVEQELIEIVKRMETP